MLPIAEVARRTSVSIPGQGRQAERAQEKRNPCPSRRLPPGSGSLRILNQISPPVPTINPAPPSRAENYRSARKRIGRQPVKKILVDESERRGNEIREQAPERQRMINAPDGRRPFIGIEAAGPSALEISQSQRRSRGCGQCFESARMLEHAAGFRPESRAAAQPYGDRIKTQSQPANHHRDIRNNFIKRSGAEMNREQTARGNQQERKSHDQRDRGSGQKNRDSGFLNALARNPGQLHRR